MVHTSQKGWSLLLPLLEGQWFLFQLWLMSIEQWQKWLRPGGCGKFLVKGFWLTRCFLNIEIIEIHYKIPVFIPATYGILWLLLELCAKSKEVPKRVRNECRCIPLLSQKCNSHEISNALDLSNFIKRCELWPFYDVCNKLILSLVLFYSPWLDCMLLVCSFKTNVLHPWGFIVQPLEDCWSFIWVFRLRFGNR